MADNTIQEIKDRLNIADVISGYIQLKKAGANFKAVCPFHHEKTPSLQVSPQKQIWHCFGCGEGGDVFGFVMKYENLEFKDTLKLLADKAGVSLPEYRPADPKLQTEKDLLLRINSFAAKYYHHVLVNTAAGKPALEYLKKRGLSLKTIEQWQIGYAPEDFHALEKALASKKVGLQDLVKAGVSSQNERGQIYDRFRGRITFPIFDYLGQVIGFSARILSDDGKSAKYVNSPETVIYNKSRVLFGVNFAKESIRRKDEAVIVEGQMDCISAHQAGFANVIASSGTALTKEQLVLLGRLTRNLKFCFDGDTAGQAASRRAGELALKEGFRLKVIILEKVKDPDELIKKSPGLWEKAVAEAVWFLDHQMSLAQQKFAGDPVAQKHYLSQEVVPLLGGISDPLEQDHYVRRLVEKFEISERVVREQIKRQGLPAAQLRQAPAVSAEPQAGPVLLEKEILGSMIAYPDMRKLFSQELQIQDFQNIEIQNLVKTLLEGKGLSGEQAQSVLAKEATFMVELELQELGDDFEVFKRQLLKSFALLKLTAVRRQQQELNFLIKQAEDRKQKEEIKQLNIKFAELAQLRLKYEGQVS